MASCPRCSQPLKGSVTSCPYCGYALTAYGHPGIPLHLAETDTFLCQTCAYEIDNSCSFPQRPHATSCTLYRDYRRPTPPTKRQAVQTTNVKSLLWLLGIVCIVGIAILLALF